MIVRQGDVLLVKVSEVPDGAVPTVPKAGRYVLAEGEVTGHAHVIVAQPGVEAYALAEALFFRVNAPVEVVHEEHDPVTLVTGIWRMVHQVEYTPERIRRVLD
jgi:hypothetical protein